MTDKETVITDLSKCTPASALSPERRYDMWVPSSYETAEHSGQCIYFSGGPKGPNEIRLPLNARGWHAIYLGLFNLGGPADRMPGHEMEFRLSGDKVFQKLCCDLHSKIRLVQDGLWKYADVTDQELVIRACPPRAAGIAWVRLVPVTKEHVEQQWADKGSKTLVFKYDPQWFTTPESVDMLIQWIEHSDCTDVFMVDKLDALFMRSSVFGSGIDRWHAPEDAGTAPATGQWKDHWQKKLIAETGRDLVDVLGEKVQAIGKRMHIGHRLAMWTDPGGSMKNWASDFFLAHPEWRIVDRDGEALPRLSLAFPEVRDYVASIYRDSLENHVDVTDGLNLTFNRGPVFMLYEQPLLDAFRARTGEDAREIDPEDETWLQCRAEAMTEFVRSIRDIRDEVAARSGKRVDISANVFCDRQQNLRLGFDVEAWVREGLVDMLIPFGVAWPDCRGDLDLDFFAGLREMSEGRCQVVISMPHTALTHFQSQIIALRHETDTARYVQRCYDAGMDGLFFWDTWPYGLAGSGLLKRLGHVDDVRWVAENREPTYLPRGSDGKCAVVTDAGDGMEGSGKPGGEYGWRSIWPTRSHLMDKFGGKVVGRYWSCTAG